MARFRAIQGSAEDWGQVCEVSLLRYPRPSAIARGAQQERNGRGCALRRPARPFLTLVKRGTGPARDRAEPSALCPALSKSRQPVGRRDLGDDDRRSRTWRSQRHSGSQRDPSRRVCAARVGDRRYGARHAVGRRSRPPSRTLPRVGAGAKKIILRLVSFVRRPIAGSRRPRSARTRCGRRATTGRWYSSRGGNRCGAWSQCG